MSRNIKDISKELLGKSLNSYHRKTGLSQGYISKLENQNKVFHSPTITQIIQISSALKVDVYILSKWFIDKELGENKNE